MIEEEEDEKGQPKQFLDDLSRISVGDLEIYIEGLETSVNKKSLDILMRNLYNESLTLE